jgi:hypothetical protein
MHPLCLIDAVLSCVLVDLDLFDLLLDVRIDVKVCDLHGQVVSKLNAHCLIGSLPEHALHSDTYT